MEIKPFSALPPGATPNPSSAIIASLARDVELGKATAKKAPYPDAAHYIILRDADGKERVEWLTQAHPAPTRKTGRVELLDAASFIEYVVRHGHGLPIYATMQPARFVAVLNDHESRGQPEAGSESGSTEVSPLKAGYKDFYASLTLAHSQEWTVWSKHNGSGAAFAGTEAFATFLEENSPDIIEPDPATFMDLALNFRVNESVSFSQLQRLTDGHVQLAFNKIVDGSSQGAGGTIKMPEFFRISVPVFAGIDAPKYECDARFRYRLQGSTVKIWYDLVRPHKVVEKAFKEVWNGIAAGIKAPILLGELKA